MTWMWFVAGVIASLVLCGAVWLLVRWWLKRSDYQTKQGLLVFTFENRQAKQLVKKDLEAFLEQYITRLLALGLFKKETLSLKGKALVWFPYPFYSEGKGWLSGIRSGNTVSVGFLPNLTKTALAHEFMHMFLQIETGDADANHTRKDYWQVADNPGGYVKL